PAQAPKNSTSDRYATYFSGNRFIMTFVLANWSGWLFGMVYQEKIIAKKSTLGQTVIKLY
ncbi:MAG TPA: hypothetical protein VLX11_09105, partial [Candidatus Acidoferrales bacterium]|nr:hypothetical protein [Candidatus Acidoferrales bacterium]